MEKMNVENISELLDSVAESMSRVADELCEMDARLGDGDLGLTMKKGFGALPDLYRSIEEPDAGKRLAKAGLKMSNVVPSTMGTLMASGVMSGAKAWAGLTEIDAKAFLAFLNGFCEGIVKRGKCARGDRTVLDAFAAAASRLDQALSENPALSLAEAGEEALAGAREGVEATRTMIPKYGKAAVHQAAAKGQPDQGACAGKYIIQGFQEYFRAP